MRPPHGVDPSGGQELYQLRSRRIKVSHLPNAINWLRRSSYGSTMQVKPPDTCAARACGNIGTENQLVALGFAGAGIPVFPCGQDKRPLVSRGFHAATTNEQEIVAWWSRHPNGLVGIPTGPPSGLWVLDVDGVAGRRSLSTLLLRLGLGSITELTPVVGKTPSGGLHLFLRWQEGESPRSRACDIAPGLDTRGVTADGKSAGYFIAPGTRLADRRSYGLIDPWTLAHLEERTINLGDAPPAPSGLLYLATFSRQERAEIAASPSLMDAIRGTSSAEWTAVMRLHRARQHATALAQRADLPAYDDAIRRQAVGDLNRAVEALAAMADNRRGRLYGTACCLAKYVAHHVLSEHEVYAALREATAANGALRRYGRRWADGTIRRGLLAGRNDTLPPVARRFRTTGGKP
jgi:hypothetical protein